MNEENNELPRGWVWTRIGDIGWVTKLAGFEFTKYFKYQETGPVRVVRGLNIGFGDFKAKDFKYIDSSISNALPRSQLQGGELLIAYVGTLGTAAILPYDGHRYHLGPNVGKVLVEPLLGPASFLLYFLISPAGQQLIRATSKAVAQSSLSMEQIRSFNVPLAPLAEQHRIVSTIEQQFTRLDAGVAALRRARTKLKRYRAAVLKAAVEGKLTETWRAEHPTTEPASILLERILKERRARWEADLRAKDKDPAKVKYVEPVKPDTENLSELPEGWCWATVEQLITYLRNGLPQKPESSPPGHRILRINAVRPMNVDLDEVRYLQLPEKDVNSYFLNNGDILFTRYNGSLDLLGVAGMVRGCFVPTLHPDKLIRIKTVLAEPLSTYMELASNVGVSRTYIESKARTTAGQTGISGSDIKQIPIPLPPLAEQEQIVSEVEQRLSVVSQLETIVEANLKRAERLRQSILKEAFAGRLVPQDPNDEPASVLLERIRKEREKQKKGKVSNGRYMNVPDEPAQINVEGTRQGKLWESVGGDE